MDERARLPGDEPLSLREKARAAPDLETSPARSPLRTALLLIVAAAIAFATYHFVSAPREASGPPQQAKRAQPVGAATVGRGDVRIVSNGLGAVTPLANVTVKTQVNGQLVEVGFTEGQNVRKGDFLAQIDPRPYQLAQQQFEGQLARDRGLLDQARNNLQRFQVLVKQESIARQQAEDQAFLVKQYEGSIKADQAQIDAQKLNLAYARIVSPIDGRVGLRLVDAGNYVQTSDTGIAVITQLHPISVIFTLPEDSLQPILDKIRAGQALEVTIFDRAAVKKLATGKLSTVDNQIDQSTGTVKLRAEFDNLDDRLFPNQFVNAQLLVDTLRDVVTAPATAIQRGAPGAYVYLIGADDTVSVRPVELGPQDGGKIEIRSGLAPGDRIVVDGTDRLRDGAEISLAALDGAPVEPAGQKAQDETRRGAHGESRRPSRTP